MKTTIKLDSLLSFTQWKPELYEPLVHLQKSPNGLTIKLRETTSRHHQFSKGEVHCWVPRSLVRNGS